MFNKPSNHNLLLTPSAMKSFVFFCCLVSLASAKNKTLRECKNRMLNHICVILIYICSNQKTFITASRLDSEPLLYLDIEECDNNCLNKDALIVSGAFMTSQPTKTLRFVAYEKYYLAVDDDYADIIEEGEIKDVLEEVPDICNWVEPNCPFKAGQLVKFKREMVIKVYSPNDFILEIVFIGDNEDFMYCSETFALRK